MLFEIFSKKFSPIFKNVCKTAVTTKQFSKDAQLSIFRQKFSPHTEEQLNGQISQELNASQAYLAISNFFGRTEISLKGATSFFLAMSREERDHALKLIKYQNLRGGRVKMHCVTQPRDEFTNLCTALEEALLIERDNTSSLMELVAVAEKDGDMVTVDFIVSEFLNEQMSSLRTLGNLLSRLNKFEQKGLGEYLIDLELQKDYPTNDE